MQLKKTIECLVAEHMSLNSNLNINNNSNNEINQNYKLIEKCLKELCKIYKIACLIELAVFLFIMSIFIFFNLNEVNAHQFWQINFTLEKNLLDLKEFNHDSHLFEMKQIKSVCSNIQNIFKNVNLII